MSVLLALSLGVTAMTPSLEHRARLEHAGGVVDAQYRGRVAIVSRQVGSVAKGGTPATLRCRWRADLRVDREARWGDQVHLARGIDRDGVLEGSRPGWCGQNEKAIAQEVAGRADRLRTHLLSLAQADEPMLRAELGRVTARRDG
ncbi:MAG TPA: hypothetical protein VF695_15635 [Sphingomonas sp.]|jgi:hypothetical protein